MRWCGTPCRSETRSCTCDTRRGGREGYFTIWRDNIYRHIGRYSLASPCRIQYPECGRPAGVTGKGISA